MKQRLVTVIILVLGMTLPASAFDRRTEIADLVVVDRSTRSKVLNDYTLLTRDAIQQSWTTPTDLIAIGALKGRIAINYTIKRSGALAAVELIQGSGNPDMDRTLLEAIRAAAPFPPFPDEISARSVMIRANFIVADLPTVPVTTADHEVAKNKPPTQAAPNESSKKYIWGAPAGAATDKPATTENEPPATVPQKKYRWGLEP